MQKIVVVGDVGVDYYQNLELLKPGGIAFNFAVNLKKAGVNNISLVSTLGKDNYSDKLIKILQHININTDHIKINTGKTPIQNISLFKDGERKFTGYNAGVLKKWKLSSDDVDFIKKQNVVFVPLTDGMETVFNIIKKIKDPIKVVDFSQDYELADFDNKENVITKNAQYFDVIFIGGKKKYEKMVESISEKYPEKVFVLTLGKEGSLAYHLGKKIFQPTLKVNKVIDTTGCGDAFQAGFLTSWWEKKNVKIALKEGTKSASIVIKHIGSTSLIIG